MAEWLGCGGARGQDSRPQSGRMRGRSPRRSWTKIRATMAGGRWGGCVPRLPGAAGRQSRRGGSRTNCAKGVCLAAVAASRQRLADLKTQAAPGAIDLVFLDESEALTHPYLA